MYVPNPAPVILHVLDRVFRGLVDEILDRLRQPLRQLIRLIPAIHFYLVAIRDRRHPISTTFVHLSSGKSGVSGKAC
jgi:hypothetical protein